MPPVEHHGADFCVAALEEVFRKHGKPDIFNTDQGSQFTCLEFTQALKDADVRISMDGQRHENGSGGL